MFKFDLPFDGDNPKPVVFVGPNGSGKSTVLSFIVNALVGFKQRVFDDVEVKKGRVYRIRSPLGIRGGGHFYHADLRFDNDIQLKEWQLDRTRGVFETEIGWTPTSSSWNQIPEHENEHFDLTFGTLNENHKIETELNSNCILYFPADRFEPPDWLNTENLSPELQLPETSRIKGRTPRRIFSRNRLKPTMEWLASVIFDMLLHEHKAVNLPMQGSTKDTPIQIPARISTPGVSTAVFNSVISILRELLAEQPNDGLQLQLGNRGSRIVSANIVRNGEIFKTIRNLLSLSAGESALFCLFTAIIRDADQAGLIFTKPEDIRGIVLIDEADLHLHLGLQYTVLPKLLALFPRVQFVLTAHSPLVILGMDATFGTNGFVVLEMPSGRQINPESYSEFIKAFDLFKNTRKFEDQILAQIISQPKPALLVEGISDSQLLQIAWEKLNPGLSLPFEIIPCGIEPDPETRSGGAETLRRCLEFLAIPSDRTLIALFDNDQKGYEQFSGVNKKAFDLGHDVFHKKHKTKAAHAILLPVPAGRELFVTQGNSKHRYLEIEHYFSDEILQKHGMMGTGILGTTVFEIVGDKVAFANTASSFEAQDFAAFASLFNRIISFI